MLVKAISATFGRRGTTIEAHPMGLGDHFIEEKAGQWTAFVRRTRLGPVPAAFREIVCTVKDFAHPLLSAAATGEPFSGVWQPGGTWSS